jgi:hypothetical protein
MTVSQTAGVAFSSRGEFNRLEETAMNDDQSSQPINTFKNLIQDFGMPGSANEIADPDFRAAALSHIDEFDEARSECDCDMALRSAA